jgi:hypothetical protein
MGYGVQEEMSDWLGETLLQLPNSHEEEAIGVPDALGD